VGRSRLALNPVVVTLAAISALFFILPLTGLVIRAPWSSMTSVITSSTSLDALWLTLIASLATTALALVFGFPMAWILARADFYGKSLLRGLTTLPMVLPPVVGGIALLLAYGRRGLIGEPLFRAAGLSLPFTTPGVIVAEAFVAMPFFVITPDRVPAGHAAADRAVAAGRVGADLVAGGRRVRRHDHVRRQPARRHPDRAAGHLHQPELGQPRRGDRAEPGAGRGQPRGHGRDAKPLPRRLRACSTRTSSCGSSG
jgi:molybdate transport system permease protein